MAGILGAAGGVTGGGGESYGNASATSGAKSGDISAPINAATAMSGDGERGVQLNVSFPGSSLDARQFPSLINPTTDLSLPFFGIALVGLIVGAWFIARKV